jgi:hypothetical protein
LANSSTQPKHKEKKKLYVADLSTEERIKRAQSKTQTLVDNAIHLLGLHEANRIIVYSPTLAAQIPKSYAANAFNLFQDASIRFEIVRLCAVLENCRSNDLDMISIPAVIQLIDDDAVLTALEEKELSHWSGVGARVYGQGEDEETQRVISEAIHASNIAFGKKQGAKTRMRLSSAIRWMKSLETSSRLKSVRNLRNKHIAHTLEQTSSEKTEPIKMMVYADERRLLWKAITIIGALHLGVNGTSFSWGESVKIARKNASLLWNGCRFTELR